MIKPDLIPDMPEVPENGEPRNSFVAKAINDWNWLKTARGYFNNILDFMDWGTTEVQNNTDITVQKRNEAEEFAIRAENAVPSGSTYTQDQIDNMVSEVDSKFYNTILLYVDAENGNDNNDGSSANPFKTLKKALEVLGVYAGKVEVRLKSDVEITENITCRYNNIEIVAHTDSYTIFFKQHEDDDNYATLNFINTNNLIFSPSYRMRLEISEKRTDTSPITSFSVIIFSKTNPSVHLGCKVDLYEENIHLFTVASYYGVGTLIVYNYYEVLNTHSKAFIVNNAKNEPVIFRCSLDDYNYAIKNIIRDADSGNPINVLSNYNFSS